MAEFLEKILFEKEEASPHINNRLIRELLIVEQYLAERIILPIEIFGFLLLSIFFYLSLENRIIVSTGTPAIEPSIIIFLALVFSRSILYFFLQSKYVRKYQLYQFYSQLLLTIGITLLFFGIAFSLDIKTFLSNQNLLYIKIFYLLVLGIRLSLGLFLFGFLYLMLIHISIYASFYYKNQAEIETLLSSNLFSFVIFLMTFFIAVLYIILRTRWIMNQMIREYLAKNDLLYENKRLVHLATVDELTGLFIFRYFQIQLEKELERAKRQGSSLSLLIIDIDNFKEINDTYGHQKGDEVIKVIANLILFTTRKYDTCARYGGDEFLILLPETDSNEALQVADRLKKNVHLFFKESRLPVTVSIGVATYNGQKDQNLRTKDDLFLKADKALYEAKKKKNYVVLSSS